MSESGQHGGAPRAEAVPRRVYVTGLGPVCAAGVGLEAFATYLWSRLDGLREIAGAGSPPGAGGQVPQFELSEFVEARHSYLDGHTRLALAAASLALSSARAGGGATDPPRSGLALGTMFGNASTQAHFHRLVREKGVRLASPVLFPHTYPNTTNSVLCIQFALRGYNQNFCGDALCGAKAIQAGAWAVRGGLADMMLAGGCEAPGERLRAMPGEGTEQAPAHGEGACLLALEGEGSMRRRGANPLCELKSVVSRGTGLDHAPSGSEEQALCHAIQAAVCAALAEAGLWEGDIGVLLLASSAGAETPLSRAGALALEGFSQVSTIGPDAVGGPAGAATFALMCAAAALVLEHGALPTPPRLQKVERGVELWVERAPSPLLGDAALVLGWTARNVVAAILKAC